MQEFNTSVNPIKLHEEATNILLECQNRLLKMFVDKEIKILDNIENAKNLLGKLLSIGDARITGIQYNYENMSDEYIEFLQENDKIFEEYYQKVYNYALKKFEKNIDTKSELESYSYEQYMDWKENAILLFNLNFGERQVYKYNGKYVLRDSIKEEGRIIGKKNEEISKEKFDELEKEYLLSRYEDKMFEIADERFFLSANETLYLKDGKFYLYRDSSSELYTLIESDTPELIERKKALELLEKFYEGLSKEEINKKLGFNVSKTKIIISEEMIKKMIEKENKKIDKIEEIDERSI